jgi:type VI secretion system secreted protein VgrG
MTLQEDLRFTFVSDAFPEETFIVVRFKGMESLSGPYHFDITLASQESGIDFRSILQHPARFTMLRQGLDNRPVFGIVSQFEQFEEIEGYCIYRAVLTPKLWRTNLYHENQLFLNKSVRDIIEEILQQARLTSHDYEFRLTGSYQPWEYICQYRETDFNFISRWMEREGIYYFFEQSDDVEKLIITDTSTAHQDILSEHQLSYSPASGLVPMDEEVVTSLVLRQKMLPHRVVLKDYNYRRPSLEIRGEAQVDPEGSGDVYIYGEHFKTPEEGDNLAGIRAQELICREKVYHGESTAANCCPGFFFDLEGHYRSDNNQRYLITEVVHEGHQTLPMLSGHGGELFREEQRINYTNRFTAIPADIQFRPERTSRKPRFYSTMNARIDASGDGQYAEIDDQGRYKVVLPFDQSGNDSGKASRWIRMAQPYSGAGYGMHFPLHKGTEVLLSFIDGDPDRPIISGSVPNPETESPVNSQNQTQCMIKTGGGNQIHTEDKTGAQLMKLHSPTDNTFVRIGAPQNGVPSGIAISTNANENTKIGQKRTLEVTGDQKYDFKSNVERKILGNKKSQTIGDTNNESIGATTITRVGQEERTNISGLKLTAVGKSEQTKVAGETALYVGSLDITGIAGNTSVWVGTKSQITIALASEIYVGGKSEVFVGAKSSVSLAAANEIFIGIKTDIKIGGLFELVVAAKLAITVAASLELAAGPKLVNTPTGIENQGIKLTQSAIKNSMAGLTNFL